MIITKCGLECFKVKFGDMVLAFNPVGKGSKLRSTSFGADIVLSSFNHPDMNGIEVVSRGEREPFVIDGPGEYEISGVTVQGFETTSKHGGEKLINTVFIVTLEDMRLCFLGALDDHKLGKELEGALDDVDVLFVPVGGLGVLDPKSAHSIAVSIGPKIVIPMHYDEKTLKTFLKEEGETNGKPVDKLTLKKKDLTGREGDIIVLSGS